MKFLTMVNCGALLLTASVAATAQTEIKLQDQGAWENHPYALEPCINGGVSATGLYPTQEIEFAALKRAAEKQEIAPNTVSKKEVE